MQSRVKGEAVVVPHFGVATSFGAREYMEDFHTTHVLDVRNKTGLFGVFDGHGGLAAAQFCAHHLHSEIAVRIKSPEADLFQAFTEAFLHIDKGLQADYECSRQQERAFVKEKGGEGEADDDEEEEEYSTAGSTAVVALVDHHRRKVVVGNVGDSRAILWRKGRAIDLARAHDPENPEERERIEAAGGEIMPNGYLSTADGSSTLSMSRSIGDFEFKADTNLSLEQQMVIAVPEILEEALGGDEDFLVLASDGIWMPSQEIVDFVATQKRQCMSLTTICKNLINKADANDNMTIIIIDLAK